MNIGGLDTRENEDIVLLKSTGCDLCSL
jgi:hypothetical protein